MKYDQSIDKFIIMKIFTVLLLIFILLVSCETQSFDDEDLNKLTDIEFTQILVKQFKKNKKHHELIAAYLDSIINLPNIDNMHKSRAYYLKAELHYNDSMLDLSIEDNTKALQNSMLSQKILQTDCYYQRGKIREKQGKFYQSLYYYNKAAEILIHNNIFNTMPYKADVLLLMIAYKNKNLNLIKIAHKYLNAALQKNITHNGNSVVLSDIYYLKASLFAVANQCNKDSLDFYYNKSIEASSGRLKERQKQNVIYLKAEFYFNANNMDSCLHYIKQLSPQITDNDVVDEINLLCVYSRLGQLENAKKELDKIKTFLKEKKLTANDSILFLENIIDYHLAKKDYKNVKKSLNEYLKFRSEFRQQEELKNIKELSLVMDLQQKDFTIEKMESYVSNIKILSISVFAVFVLMVIIIVMYFRTKEIRKRLQLENEKIKLQKNTTDLKMKLLQSQINPHFIFNTLASIQGQIRLQKNDEAIHYLNSFAKLMRDILESSRSSSVSLKTELKMIEKYVELQKLRSDNFILKTIVDDKIKDELDDIYVQALTLQPFVENSILHGFKNINYQGEIVLRIVSENEKLRISIIDNGCGLGDADYSNQHESHGINIIKEKFAILEKDSSVSIANRTDRSGVKVEIIFR